jgi:alanine dehydrogenase
MKYSFIIPDYESSGAKVVDKKAAFQSDIVLKVRAPTPNETGLFRDQV